MAITEIAYVCRSVADFGARQNWRFNSTPVIAWEFGNLHEFHGAKIELLRMIASEPYYMMQNKELVRVIDSATLEIDCYGVVFRLTCNQRLMTEAGEVGATQVQYREMPIDMEALARMRRKSAIRQMRLKTAQNESAAKSRSKVARSIP